MNNQDAPPDPDAAGQKAQEAAQEAEMRDWMTLWHSEAAAMGVDREMQESWARMAEVWTGAGAADMLARMMPGWPGTGCPGAGWPGTGPSGLDPAGSAGADAASRPAAAADASDAGELASLRRELGELRRRIERLEGAPDRRRRKVPGT